MKVWGVPFHTIESEWTDDQFYMMLDRLGERLGEEKKAYSKKGGGGHSQGGGRGSQVSGASYSPQEFLTKIGRPTANGD